MNDSSRPFKPLSIAVLTVSDTRVDANDKSGKLLVERLQAAGHELHEKAIVKDDIYAGASAGVGVDLLWTALMPS